MKLPNGYGSVVKLSGKQRKPYMVRKTLGLHFDKEKDRQVQDYLIIGYATTRAEGLQMLADYNNNPYDTKSATRITPLLLTLSNTKTVTQISLTGTSLKKMKLQTDMDSTRRQVLSNHTYAPIRWS